MVWGPIRSNFPKTKKKEKKEKKKKKKKTQRVEDQLNMIVQHFPAYNTSVPGYGTKIDVCFSTDTHSLSLSVVCPLDKTVQRSRHFLLSSLANSFELPLNFFFLNFRYRG